MSITANLISGAFLKYKINRNGESLELGFSNDRAILKEQTSKMAQWLKLRDKETNQDVFNRLEKLLQSSKSGAEVISNLEKF